MRPGLAGRLSRALVSWHPRRWRDRYGEEMLDVLDQHQPTARTVANLWASAVSAQLDPAYRTDRLSLPRLRRAALISALVAQLADPDRGWDAIANDRVTHIWAVRNPEKLRSWMATY